MKYWNEGLADLFYLLNAGYKEVDSIDVAKCVFQRGVQTVQQRMYHDGMTKDDWNKDIFSRMDCYEAGPWLMLDLLRSFEGCWHEKIIDQALREIAAGQPLERSKILEIIRIALRVKLEDFLDYIQPLVPAYKMDIPVGLTQQLTLN